MERRVLKIRRRGSRIAEVAVGSAIVERVGDHARGALRKGVSWWEEVIG
jgi:hypothetical protein